MLSEYEERARALVERVARRDDYGTLLMDGYVIRRESELPDPDAWRADIRRGARADRMRVQTTRSKGRVGAVIARSNVPAAKPLDLSFRAPGVQPETPEDRGKALGHTWSVIHDGDEAVPRCTRCGAVGYLTYGDGETVVDGYIFGLPCEPAADE